MAKGKFHINDEGRVMPCSAQSGNCPFGDDDQHFDNFEEAQLAADKKNELLTKGNDDRSSSKTQEEKKMKNLTEKQLEARTETINTLIAEFGDEDGKLAKELNEIYELKKQKEKKKNLKILQNELNTTRKALQHLADYQSVFEYGEQSEEEWNSLQETMRELYVIQGKLQKQKTELNEVYELKKQEEKKKNLKILQNELNTTRKALQHLADYQSVFEYNEQSEKEWNNLQETMRELYVIQERLQKQKESL